MRGAAVFFFVVLRAFDEVCFFAEDELLEAEAEDVDLAVVFFCFCAVFLAGDDVDDVDFFVPVDLGVDFFCAVFPDAVFLMGCTSAMSPLFSASFSSPSPGTSSRRGHCSPGPRSGR